MAKDCFCGCGLHVPWGRRRAANAVGDRIDRDIATFQGALERGDQGEEEPELRELVALGVPMRDTLRGIVHGTMDRREYDKRAGRAWLRRASVQRGRLAKAMVAADYVGRNAVDQSELVHSGRTAPGVVLEVRDTGMTVNTYPRVLVRLRVEPDGEAPFEVGRKVLVSRVAFPRVGERVEVAYDPDDRDRFTFRRPGVDDAAGEGPGADRLEQLARLGELRDGGVLTEEEFEAEKARILERD